MEITDDKGVNIEMQRKPLLSIDEQIEHLKSKGVTFDLCSEKEARHYLSDRTYFFKIAAFRVLFRKHIGGKANGQYANLDFGHLQTLASFDRTLRYALLPLTLDVEHAARVKLIHEITERADEDGYSITRDYLLEYLNHNERRRRENEITMLHNDAFSGDIVRKYDDPKSMPIWVIMELFSFGSFISLYLYCAERWNDEEMRNEHYMLRQAQFVRNACAHSSNICNGFAASDSNIATNITIQNALARTGLSHRVRTTKMRNPRLKQIATLLYLHSQMVSEGTGRTRAMYDLQQLSNQIDAVLEKLTNNDPVRSSLSFLKTLIDSWF